MNGHATKTSWLTFITIGNAVATVIILLIVLIGFPRSPAPASATAGSSGNTKTATITDAQVQQVAAQVLPRGKPFYGDELGVSYDQAEAGITILGQFDSYGSKPIKLEGEKLQRYIKIGQSIACEYCCGAKTMTLPDGNPACGCAHSQAMRGVALYLLDKYGDKLSDQEIFNEVAKWKALSFPQETVRKALASLGGSTASALNALPQQQGGC